MTGHKDGRIRLYDTRTGKKEVAEIVISNVGNHITELKNCNLGSFLITTDGLGKLSKSDLRMGTAPIWTIEHEHF